MARTGLKYRNERGVGLIELIIVAILLAIMGYFVMKRVSSEPHLDAQTRQTLLENGIDTSNYGTILSTTRGALNDMTNTSADLLKKAGVNIYGEQQ